MERLENVIFYTIDKAIKSYRQFAQKRIRAAGHSITIDQWLILRNIQENPLIQQKDLSKKVFKDRASVTRIIELLVQSNLLEREEFESDRRRRTLNVTSKGNQVLEQAVKIVEENRLIALKGVSLEQLETTKKTLEQIIINCQE